MDPTIGDLGLIDSIHDLIENINLTRKLLVSLEADRKLETILSKNHKLTIFRILQETLNNAMKHAKARTVTISFRLKNKNAELIIKDDGIGFDPLVAKMGAGLKNIQNRVYLINGTNRIISAPKEGCKIIINFPIVNKT
jgi:signal transduction histidine kinase